MSNVECSMLTAMPRFIQCYGSSGASTQVSLVLYMKIVQKAMMKLNMT